MDTIYTMKRDDQGDLIALILTPSNNTGKASEMSYYRTPMELHQAVKEHYGDDAAYVSPRFFQTALEDRQFHSPEMLEMLRDNPEGDLSRRYVYGSPMRPMSSVWARLPGAAIYIPCDRQKTGFHTYIAVLAKLDKEITEKYDLVFVSHGKEQN